MFTCQKIIGFVEEIRFKVSCVKLHMLFFWQAFKSVWRKLAGERILEYGDTNDTVGRKSTGAA